MDSETMKAARDAIADLGGPANAESWLVCQFGPGYAQTLALAGIEAATAEQPALMRESVEWLLRLVAMVPERDLPGMGIDPYGTIGDALESIGRPKTPDAWRALQQWAHGIDPGPPEIAEQPAADEVAKLAAVELFAHEMRTDTGRGISRSTVARRIDDALRAAKEVLP